MSINIVIVYVFVYMINSDNIAHSNCTFVFIFSQDYCWWDVLVA